MVMGCRSRVKGVPPEKGVARQRMNPSGGRPGPRKGACPYFLIRKASRSSKGGCTDTVLSPGIRMVV